MGHKHPDVQALNDMRANWPEPQDFEETDGLLPQAKLPGRQRGVGIWKRGGDGWSTKSPRPDDPEVPDITGENTSDVFEEIPHHDVDGKAINDKAWGAGPREYDRFQIDGGEMIGMSTDRLRAGGMGGKDGKGSQDPEVQARMEAARPTRHSDMLLSMGTSNVFTGAVDSDSVAATSGAIDPATGRPTGRGKKIPGLRTYTEQSVDFTGQITHHEHLYVDPREGEDIFHSAHESYNGMNLGREQGLQAETDTGSLASDPVTGEPDPMFSMLGENEQFANLDGSADDLIFQQTIKDLKLDDAETALDVQQLTKTMNDGQGPDLTKTGGPMYHPLTRKKTQDGAAEMPPTIATGAMPGMPGSAVSSSSVDSSESHLPDIMGYSPMHVPMEVPEEDMAPDPLWPRHIKHEELSDDDFTWWEQHKRRKRHLYVERKEWDDGYRRWNFTNITTLIEETDPNVCWREKLIGEMWLDGEHVNADAPETEITQCGRPLYAHSDWIEVAHEIARTELNTTFEAGGIDWPDYQGNQRCKYVKPRTLGELHALRHEFEQDESPHLIDLSMHSPGRVGNLAAATNFVGYGDNLVNLEEGRPYNKTLWKIKYAERMRKHEAQLAYKNGTDQETIHRIQKRDNRKSHVGSPWQTGNAYSLVLPAEPKTNCRANVMRNSALQLIGRTPLVRLKRLQRWLQSDAGGNLLPRENKIELYGKAELFSAGGSIKDRIAHRMIEAAENHPDPYQRIKPGRDIIIEPTSGNTGIGLCLAAAIKGYKVIITMPRKMSGEKVNMMKALGALVFKTPTEAAWRDTDSHIGLALRLQKALTRHLRDRFDGGPFEIHDEAKAVILDQYRNAHNPLAHYYGTAEEIIQQIGYLEKEERSEAPEDLAGNASGAIDDRQWQFSGKDTYLVASAGTGGTISGLAWRLKEPDGPEGMTGGIMKVVGVDPVGSLLALPNTLNEGPKRLKGYQVEGIGYDFIPSVLDRGGARLDEDLTYNIKPATEAAYKALLARQDTEREVMEDVRPDLKHIHDTVNRIAKERNLPFQERPGNREVDTKVKDAKDEELSEEEKAKKRDPRLIEAERPAGWTNDDELRADRKAVDFWVKTSDKESFRMARALIRTEGLMVGGSSGSALVGAVRAIRALSLGHKTQEHATRVIVMLPDSSRNYMSKFLDDGWMGEHGFL